MNINYLFHKTLQDLKEKVHGDYYQKVKACGLLRHLFVDSHPLAHQVSRQVKFKLEFEISVTNIREGHEDACTMFQNILPGDGSRKVKLNEFLNFAAMKFENEFITVRDIIKGASHFNGGVHTGNPTCKEEKFIYEKFNEGTLHLYAVEGIVEVSIKALIPLDELIDGKNQVAHE